MNRDRDEVTERRADGSPDGSRRTLGRVHEWVFLTGNRWVLAGGLLVGFLVVLGAIELRMGLATQQLVPLFYATSAVIGGNFTLLTIVISISQLVISQQLSAPGELRAQIEDTTAYRETSTESVGREVAPATPAAFLEVLLEGVLDAVRSLESHRDELTQNGAADAVDEVLDPLEAQLERSVRELRRGGTTIFEALVVTLDTNYSREIYQIWRLQTVYEEDISPDAKECLGDVVERLKQIDVARQYIKTVYIQEELARLSRDLLYVGVPIIFAGLALMVTFVSTDRPMLSPRQLSIITPVFAAVGAAPLALLFAYVLRLSVVSERTVAITPFTTPTQESTPLETVADDADD
ncbi:hypothetical protein [Halorussus sp. AFM4]|uniref:hypothetical protein n=1 Tax=Halorussus sp. AFM4 TaxID=3421651 RepID=UPI003EC0E2B6